MSLHLRIWSKYFVCKMVLGHHDWVPMRCQVFLTYHFTYSIFVWLHKIIVKLPSAASHLILLITGSGSRSVVCRRSRTTSSRLWTRLATASRVVSRPCMQSFKGQRPWKTIFGRFYEQKLPIYVVINNCSIQQGLSLDSG